VSPGTLFSFINLFSLLTYPLRTIGYVLGNVPRSMAGYDRVRRVLDEEVPAPARGTSALPAGPLDLRADGVTFAHSGGNRVLDELSFEVKAGTTLAVAGPTGCGKTTLVFLLAGLLRPSAGSVRLGGADVSDLAPGDVTRACATVLQDPFLFAGTIEENILLGHEAADGEVAAALRLAGVAEFVDSLPHGTRTTVGERGVTLSGGQRQRVALARALVRSPRLLILDDATSAVDPTTEDRILRGIAAGLHGVTKVVVASRPSTLALADSVLYLEKNRPACLGTHEWLLARVPGYQDLVRAYESEGSRA
jgi:ABC-type multidrug transport system fused ATPase/permease subunit